MADEEKRPHPAVAKPAAAPHTPKAWYSATGDGRRRCHRCGAVVDVEALDEHTAVCWPEAGTPWT